jgi:hypothetical protein
MKERRPRRTHPREEPEPRIVRLEDLAPPEDVRGGGKKRIFGEEPVRRAKKPNRG